MGHRRIVSAPRGIAIANSEDADRDFAYLSSGPGRDRPGPESFRRSADQVQAIVLIGEYVPFPPRITPLLLSEDLRIEIEPLPLLTRVPTGPELVTNPSIVNDAATVPRRPVLAAGHLLRAVCPVSVHGRLLGATLWPPEQELMVALVMLPPLPGRTIGPLLTDPPSVTSQVNSPIRNPLKPSPLIVADMAPPGLAVTDVALATAAEAAISAVAINSDVSVLRMFSPL
jgi:hypothetical protein